MSASLLSSLGGYEVLAELDSGGMGDVLIARKRAVGGFERLVALKTVRGELQTVDAARDMFLDEGKLLARLHHRGIAQVYDFGEDGDQLFLAMEYVAGVDFDDLAERSPDPAIACLAMAEAARALHAAHELRDSDGAPLGVVHRDVSPGNLMLTFDGAVKVLDFGIALMRGRRAPVTEFGMLKGKPPYMAPEQVRSEAVDARTDVFSACAVLWELLTDIRLFTGDSIYAIGRAIESGEVPPPSAHRPEVIPALDAVILRGLAKNPADRFAGADELAASLEEIAKHLGAEALPVYARRELAEDRKKHNAYLAEISRAKPKPKARVGRETHSHTIPAFEVADTAPGDDAKPAKANLERDLPPELGSAPPTRRSKWPLVLAMVGGLALLGVAAWQLGVASRTTAVADAGIDSLVALDATLEARVDAGLDAAIDASADAAIDAPPVVIKRRKDGGPVVVKKRKDGGPTAVRKKPDAAPPKPTGFGRLNVPPADPYVDVILNGKPIGPSPKNVRLSAGTHTVTFTDPAKGGAVIKTRTFEIEVGKTTTIRAPNR